MPRLRPTGHPRHRAKRQRFRPARGVGSAAARHAATFEGPTAAGAKAASEQAVGRKLGSRQEYGRILRGALLTPWFAVSVGIVVATSLTLATPHTALTFPPTRSGRCIEANCASPSVSPAAPAPAIKHEVRLRRPRPDADVLPAGIKVEYQLLTRRQDHFIAMILVVAHRSLGRWRLKFVLPGATIGTIMWAKWQPDGPSGVVVSGSPLPWERSGANEARIVVSGTGVPRWPTGCEFDNVACRFTAITASSPQRAAWAGIGE